MNSSTLIELSIGQIATVFVTLVGMVVTIFFMGVRASAKFTLERSLTVTAIESASISAKANVKEVRSELISMIDAVEIKTDKNKEDLHLVRDTFRSDLERKTDQITVSLEAIKSMMNTLSTAIASKYVERPEIDNRFARLDDRVSLVEQGVTKMVGQNDQMLSLLAGIKVDTKRSRIINDQS